LFAACQKRLVTRYSTLMFHHMRWQSEKRIGAIEAHRWARHFKEMEDDIDDLQARLFGRAKKQLAEWTAGGHYVTGPEIVAAGLAELLEL
jgi:ATP-dependent protease ClpP protease subunit